ncbi:MAG: DUF3419 family protein [Bacilli bacterium]|nr:DUF3419 family protein [Bacilli bacterium]
MTQLKKDALTALEILNEENYDWPVEYSKVFANTNEQLSAYFKMFPIYGEKVLTVAASGDHLLQAVSNGAKSVDVFDNNRFTFYIVRLKIAALKVLSHEEFENFFSINNGADYFFSPSIYEKIRDYLDFEGRVFWDSVYQYGNIKHIFRLVFGPQRHDLGKDSYRDEDNYYAIREVIDDVSIRYLYSNLFHLHKVLDERYKVIFLSNIYDWISRERKDYFKRYVLFELSKYLDDDGLMAVYAPVLGPGLQFKAQYSESTEIDSEKVYIYKKE